MKKLFIILAAVMVAIVSVVFVSCKKNSEVESIVNNEQNIVENTEGYQLPELLKTGITVENGIMVFTDAENYFEITELLIAENDKWNEDFYQTWKDLSEEEFNAKIKELNFNCDYTYEVFEKYHNFTSLRSKIAEANKEWLGH